MAMLRKGWRWQAVVVISGIALLAAIMGPTSNASAPGPAGVSAAKARTGRIAAGRMVHAQTSKRPFVPTKAQRQARTQAMAGLAEHIAPSLGAHTTAADVASSGGPQTGRLSPQAPGDFKVLKNSLINSTCSGCGQSSINEPSVTNNGRFVVETSNWNIAYTVHANQNPVPWSNQNPYSISSGFCCDQEVVYDAQRDVYLLLQLDYTSEGAATNGLALSIARGSTPTAWCTYKFAGAIGGGATDTPDFPKIALANNNAYVTWNDYPPNAGFARAGLARFPLDSLASCAGFSYNFITRTTEFTFALSQAKSSLDQFYWVSNWFLDGTTNGSNMRIFWWPENSGSYFFVTRAINAYTFGNVSCGSPNWCSRLDPRYESVIITRAEYRALANSAFAGDSIMEIATSAGPSGFSSGKNYVVYNYFKLNSLTYIGNDQTFSTSTNFAYPGCGVNVQGHVGCALAEGTNVPDGFVVLQDDVSPSQPWNYSYPVIGVNGASAWGDYIVTSPWNPQVGPFQTVLWRVNGSNVVQPYYIVWGRTRDTNGFNRWKAK
jgi:hypothetical protein